MRSDRRAYEHTKNMQFYRWIWEIDDFKLNQTSIYGVDCPKLILEEIRSHYVVFQLLFSEM